MLKERRQLFEFLFMVFDLLVVTVAWLCSYWIRFESGLFPLDKGRPELIEYLTLLVLIVPVWSFTFRLIGLYRPMRGVSNLTEQIRLLYASSLAVVVFIAMVYIFREKTVPFSRAVFLWFWLFSTSLVIIERSCLRFLLRDLRRKGYNLRYVLIVGNGKLASDLVKRIRNRQELGIQLVGCVSKNGPEVDEGPEGLPVVGGYDEIKDILKNMDIDQVVVALSLEEGHALPAVMSQFSDSLVDVKIVPDIHQFISLFGSIEEFEGLPMIGIQVTPIEGINLFIKRVFDIVVSLVFLLVISPLLLLISLLIKLTSRGPIFYNQERVSIDGSRFTIFKFRSMKMNAEVSGPGWTKPGDARVTPLGRFLRATSLDELPQFFNVLKGEMSIVGPRPERPVYIDEFRRRIPQYMLRHKVPAGITGWAQINGWRGDTPIDKRIEFDLYYIEHWSFLFDLKILFLTLFKGFKNENAY